MTAEAPLPHPQLTRLIEVVRRLRAPGGCPWDRQQSQLTMAPHLLEEAYEAVEAIERGHTLETAEELGDVLMNVLMIAQIASEEGQFDAGDVAHAIADKLVRRHPHVFGDVQAKDTDTVLQNWEAIKRSEKGGKNRGTLDGLPTGLPGLLKAFRMGEKVARVGFDWPDRVGPRAKVDEELAELDEALETGDPGRVKDELGDVLFAVVNLARHAGVNPEMALRGTIDRFATRFAAVEQALGDRLGDASLEEMEAAWQKAKND